MPKRKQSHPAIERFNVIDAFPFDTLQARISVPAEQLREYKRFLALKAAVHDFDATLLSPPEEIDTIWHAHILDTKHYRLVCNALGHFIDHDPDGGTDARARDARLKASLDEYEKAFGAAPDCWRRAAGQVVTPRQVITSRQPATVQERQQPAIQSKRAHRGPAASKDPLVVGACVKAKYKASSIGPFGTVWFSGWIAAKHADGNFGVCYEDGDIETFVMSKYVKLAVPQDAVPMPAWAKASYDEEASKQAAAAINLKVVTQDGKEIFFKCKISTPLQKLMSAFCNRQGVAAASVRFMFDGKRIDPEATPADVFMEDGDLIDVIVEQRGC